VPLPFQCHISGDKRFACPFQLDLLWGFFLANFYIRGGPFCGSKTPNIFCLVFLAVGGLASHEISEAVPARWPVLAAAAHAKGLLKR
jgi:hypothetical protein